MIRKSWHTVETLGLLKGVIVFTSPGMRVPLLPTPAGMDGRWSVPYAGHVRRAESGYRTYQNVSVSSSNVHVPFFVQILLKCIDLECLANLKRFAFAR